MTAIQIVVLKAVLFSKFLKNAFENCLAEIVKKWTLFFLLEHYIQCVLIAFDLIRAI